MIDVVSRFAGRVHPKYMVGVHSRHGPKSKKRNGLSPEGAKYVAQRAKTLFPSVPEYHAVSTNELRGISTAHNALKHKGVKSRDIFIDEKLNLKYYFRKDPIYGGRIAIYFEKHGYVQFMKDWIAGKLDFMLPFPEYGRNIFGSLVREIKTSNPGMRFFLQVSHSASMLALFTYLGIANQMPRLKENTKYKRQSKKFSNEIDNLSGSETEYLTEGAVFYKLPDGRVVMQFRNNHWDVTKEVNAFE